MGQRNIMCPYQLLDLNVDQRGPSYLQPTLHPSANPTNFEGHHLREHHDGALFYERNRTQYERVQHHHPIGNPVPYVPQASSNVILPVSLNYGSSDHLTIPNNYGNLGVSVDEYLRHCHLMDADRDSYNKRKYTENLPGIFHHASSSSYEMPRYTGNASSSSQRQVGSSVRNRSGFEPVMTHNNYNRMLNMDQPFGPSGVDLFDRQAGSNYRDGGASSVHNLPYRHGNNIIGGSVETANMTVPWYHETANNITSASFVPPLPVNLRHPNVVPPVAHMQGSRSRNTNFVPPVPMASYRIPTNYVSRSTSNPSQDGMNFLAGRRISGPQRMEGVVPQTASRHRSFPHLRFMPADEVAMLELSEYYEMRNPVDHHRDMRLDIEHMSYEELLALEERIGSVSIGLSEETINRQLKTRTYWSSAIRINLEECPDQDSDSCIICQEEYTKKEKIGILSCGHEYHAECLTKWLLVKNACPICKSEGLKTESKH